MKEHMQTCEAKIQRQSESEMSRETNGYALPGEDEQEATDCFGSHCFSLR